MKIFQKFGYGLIFILAFAVLAIAQTEIPQTTTPNKIALVNSDIFKDKEKGIKELVEIYDKLEIEFKAQKEELEFLFKEVKKKEEGLKYVTHTVSWEVLENRSKEYKIAVSKFETKQKEIKSLFEKRELEVTVSIKKKMAEAADLFAKEKGYAIVLDVSKFPEPFILAESNNVDITDEFIKYCNEKFAKNKSQ